MYFLAKIHKDPVKLRPIVSCTKGPTCTASEFLDRILQPHMWKVKSYVRNSMDLHVVHTLRRLKVRPNAYLITLDVESLYTNNLHEEAITSFLRIHRKHPQKIFLLDLLKYVLKNDVPYLYLTYQRTYLTQLIGLLLKFERNLTHLGYLAFIKGESPILTWTCVPLCTCAE